VVFLRRWHLRRRDVIEEEEEEEEGKEGKEEEEEEQEKEKEKEEEEEGHLVQQDDLSDQTCSEGAAVPASSMPLPGAKARHRALCA